MSSTKPLGFNFAEDLRRHLDNPSVIDDVCIEVKTPERSQIEAFCDRLTSRMSFIIGNDYPESITIKAFKNRYFKGVANILWRKLYPEKQREEIKKQVKKLTGNISVALSRGVVGDVFEKLVQSRDQVDFDFDITPNTASMRCDKEDIDVLYNNRFRKLLGMEEVSEDKVYLTLETKVFFEVFFRAIDELTLETPLIFLGENYAIQRTKKDEPPKMVKRSSNTKSMN